MAERRVERQIDEDDEDGNPDEMVSIIRDGPSTY